MDEWRVERLDREHVREGFDCRKRALNDFLQVLVSQYEKRNLGRTYVAVPKEDRRILGYYTLASGEIKAGSLPANRAKKLPRQAVPVILLARLAVDQSVHGRGLDGYLLRDALTRSLDPGEQIGIHALVVDALDAEAKTFYVRLLAISIAISGLFTQLTVAVADGGDDPTAKAPSKQAGSTKKQKTAIDPNAPKLPEPPATWHEHCFEHRELVKLVASNDDVAIYSLWRDHGHAQVMVNFFELVAKHFPRGPYGNDRHPRYTRRMTWGEFIHFMSGAAHKDIRPLARRAFGWPPEWNDLYKKARQDFPDIKYPA